MNISSSVRQLGPIMGYVHISGPDLLRSFISVFLDKKCKKYEEFDIWSKSKAIASGAMILQKFS